MRAEDIEQLRQLFGAYFHQDWDLDAPDPDGVLDRFIADHPAKEDLAKLAALVESYAGSQGDDTLLERGLRGELWCEYIPSADGLRARDWLQRVANRLHGAAGDG